MGPTASTAIRIGAFFGSSVPSACYRITTLPPPTAFAMAPTQCVGFGSAGGTSAAFLGCYKPTDLRGNDVSAGVRPSALAGSKQTVEQMQREWPRIDLLVEEGADHGYFNDFESCFRSSLASLESFLHSIGYIESAAARSRTPPPEGITYRSPPT